MKTFTRKHQEDLTPLEAIQLLKQGNERFVNNLKINRNLLQQINETSESQHPFAIILNCMDSRSVPELFFDQGLADLFTVRVAGNILNDDIVGSMEFACKIAGAKLIIVLGHTECGAIKGACDHVEMGKLTGLLKKISPAMRLANSAKHNKNPYSSNFVDNVALLNVKVTMNQISKKSSILTEMARDNEIKIVGGMYDVSTGVVLFMEE